MHDGHFRAYQTTFEYCQVTDQKNRAGQRVWMCTQPNPSRYLQGAPVSCRLVSQWLSLLGITAGSRHAVVLQLGEFTFRQVCWIPTTAEKS